MKKLIIRARHREMTPEEALESVTTPYNAEGVVERLRETIELQNKVLANMLKVQFGIYDEDFSDPEHYPSTDAERLRFILGGGVANITVNEE